METLAELDKELFFFLNGLHTPWLDPFMFYVSETLTWLPVYLILLVVMIRNFGWQTLLWLAGVALAILLADQITSGLMKPFFERFRPSRDPEIPDDLVHIVNGYTGGKYGFASSHAANAFAVATYLFLLLKDRLKFAGWLFIMAGLIAYSRIYLGVHFPGDIIVGGLIGALSGWLSYRLFNWISIKWISNPAAQG
jgi:undecaprenyl-diphosphatase